MEIIRKLTGVFDTSSSSATSSYMKATAIAVGSVSIASFFYFYIFDSRLYDLNGKILPGPDSNFSDKSFKSVMVRARKLKKASVAMHEELLQTIGDGKIIGVNYFKFRQIIIVAHPDYAKDILKASYTKMPKGGFYNRFKFLIGNGLLTSNGAIWLMHRKLISPSFEFSEFKYFCDTIVQSTKANLLDRWVGKNTINLNVEMPNLTSNIICESAFGFKLGDRLDESFVANLVLLGYELNDRIMDVFDWSHQLDIWRTRKVNKVLQGVIDLILSIIDERMASRKKIDAEYETRFKSKENIVEEEDATLARGCLLDLLLDASDKSADGVKLSQEDLKDHMMTFFLAGHETTSSSILWTMYELCRPENKEIYIRCVEEVDKVFDEIAERGGDKKAEGLEFADTAKLVYMQSVFKESLRLHPVIGILSRQVTGTSAEGDGGSLQLGEYSIPEGYNVAICLYSLHRNPDFWDNPNLFDPERFASGTKLKHPFQYIPFSSGHRNCIGQKFAMLEMTIIVATILRNYSFSMTDEAISKVLYEEHITNQPKGMDINITVRR